MSDYYTCTIAEADAANANLFISDIRACGDCTLHRWHLDGAFACPGWFPEFGIDLLFVGMSPGEDEDKAGRPFVGKAGKKLMSLADSVGLTPDVFSFGFTNIVRCHTPSNRPPTGQEADACRRWLDIEIDMADPAVICLLGNSAIPLAFPGKKIGEVAGDSRAMGGRIYIACYHPAAILHRPDHYTEESIKAALRMAREVVERRR